MSTPRKSYSPVTLIDAAIPCRETKAEKLYDAGCRTLEDIERLGMVKTFNRATQVAYRYVDHLDKNVMREQAEVVKVCALFEKFT